MENRHKYTEHEGVGLIHLAEDRDKWRDLLNTVMNFRVIQKAQNFLIV
jgi:hypothetical protein